MKEYDKKDLEAYLEGLVSERRKRRFREVLEMRTRFLTVALEDVYQLHNTSAVIRSCDAFGIQDVHLVEKRFGKRLDQNIAVGAQQWVELHRFREPGECMCALRSKGYRLLAACPGSDSTPLDRFDLAEPTAIFFGTEKEGLSPEILTGADERIHIPMHGFSESFNVSVAVAIVLYRLVGRLWDSGRDWRLNAEERQIIYRDWIRKSVKDAPAIEKRFLGTNNS